MLTSRHLVFLPCQPSAFAWNAVKLPRSTLNLEPKRDADKMQNNSHVSAYSEDNV